MVYLCSTVHVAHAHHPVVSLGGRPGGHRA
jgi:hypothetical protein